VGAGTGNRPGYPTFVAGGRAAPAGVPDPELVERAKRRTFTAKYKLEILEKAEACTRPGEIGELLRREGLYTSHLTAWRNPSSARRRRAGSPRSLMGSGIGDFVQLVRRVPTGRGVRRV